MQARYYDPVIGRFYSNDPVGWNPENPVHSFGRYTYANNNPYKYTDPTGMAGEDTYKQEIKKPELKTITAEIDIVVTVKSSAVTSTSVGLISGKESKNSFVDLGPTASLSESQDLQTGEKTSAVKLSTGPFSTSINSNNDITLAAEVPLGAGSIAVTGTTSGTSLGHNISAALSKAVDTLKSTAPGGF